MNRIKTVVKYLKLWQWALIGGGLLVVIVGIGFVPIGTIPHDYSYTCNKTECESCVKTREVTDTLWVLHDIVEEEVLSFETWGFHYGFGDGYVVWEEVYVKNTDTESGLFEVTFHCFYGRGAFEENEWHSIKEQQTLSPGESWQFQQVFPLYCVDPECEETWECREPDIEGPTRSVVYSEWQPEEKTTYEEYLGECCEEYVDVCESTWYETRRLFWRWLRGGPEHTPVHVATPTPAFTSTPAADSTPTPTPTATAQPTDEEEDWPRYLDLGEPCEHFWREVVVTSSSQFRTYSFIASDGMERIVKAAPGNTFVLVEAYVKNLGEAYEFFRGTDFALVDSQGFSYHAKTYHGGNAFGVEPVYPGQTAEGMILYEVPEDVSGLQAVYDFGLGTTPHLAVWEL